MLNSITNSGLPGIGVLPDSQVPIQAPAKEDGEPAKDFAQVLQKSKSSPKPKDSPKTVDRKLAEEQSGMTQATEEREVNPSEPEAKVNSKVNGQTKKQKVMQKFMDSLESEFGIPPERLVEAMAKLSSNDLSLPPEQTAQKIISQLGLSPQEQVKATRMYLQMVRETGDQKIMSPTPDLFAGQASGKTKSISGNAIPVVLPAMLPASGIANGEGIKVPLQSAPSDVNLASQFDRKIQLNQGLDRMNSQFFMQPAGERSFSELASIPGETRLPLEGYEFLPKEDPAFANGTVIESTPQSLEDALAQLANASDGLGEMATQTPVQTPVEAEAFESSWALKVKPNEHNLAALGVVAPPAYAMSGSNKNFTGGFSQNDKGEDSSRDFQTEGLDLKSGDLKNDFMVHSMEARPEKGASVDAAAIGLGANANANTQGSLGDSRAEKAANIQKLMDQANVLVKRGGGEMKVQLTPEGLGPVQLKINVQDGKVDLQVSTETREAKQLVESSLHDLRNSLSQHKLSVENVKVDVGTDSQRQDQSQQRMADAQADLSREQARQFLGQFKEQTFAQRQNYFDAPEIKPFQPKNPDEVETQSTSRRRGEDYKGQGLNLVA